MFHFLIISHYILAAVTQAGPAPTQPTSALLYVLGALCAGGILTLVYNVVQRWRRGQIEDTALINRITQQTIQGADDILQQYRVEVAAIKLQVEDYRAQLHSVTRELAQATMRIANLEADLAAAHTEQERLRQDNERLKREQDARLTNQRQP